MAVLLEATVWLEEKYRRAPSREIADALALQYLVLAMRRAQASPATTKEYLTRAVHWRAEAARAFSVHLQLPAPLSLN